MSNLSQRRVSLGGIKCQRFNSSTESAEDPVNFPFLGCSHFLNRYSEILRFLGAARGELLLSRMYPNRIMERDDMRCLHTDFRLNFARG